MIKVVLFTLISTVGLLAVEISTGIGTYYAKAKGTVEYHKDFFVGSTSKIDNKAQNHFYVWSEFDIKKKYFPKVRVDYTRIRSTGTSVVKLGTTNIVITELVEATGLQNTPLHSVLVYNIYDAFMYYDFFDHSLYPTLTVGTGIKSLDYDYDIELFDGVQFNDQGSSTIPMVFFKMRKVVYSDIAMELETKYYPFGESDAYDFRIKTDIYFDLNEQIETGFELGYRDSFIDIKGDDIDKVGGDMHYQGLFFGLVAKFR